MLREGGAARDEEAQPASEALTNLLADQHVGQPRERSELAVVSLGALRESPAEELLLSGRLLSQAVLNLVSRSFEKTGHDEHHRWLHFEDVVAEGRQVL